MDVINGYYNYSDLDLMRLSLLRILLHIKGKRLRLSEERLLLHWVLVDGGHCVWSEELRRLGIVSSRQMMMNMRTVLKDERLLLKDGYGVGFRVIDYFSILGTAGMKKDLVLNLKLVCNGCN